MLEETAFRTDLLTELYADIQKKNIEILKTADNISLGLDGWEDQQKRSIYLLLATVKGHDPIILELQDLSDVRHTASCLQQFVNESIVRAEVSWDAVSSLFTDSPSTMVKLHVDLEKEHPSLLIRPSSALIKENSAIIRFYTTSHIWKARLGDIRKLENVTCGLRSEVATRWYYIGHLLHTLIGHEYDVYNFHLLIDPLMYMFVVGLLSE
ncbi:hypothetical protein BT69DRAFT_1212326 [Atractiella rhizophila]|nr:hypothetical protein BT69DRAFT_1212326 [Atractiella rhizophila]